MTTDLVQFIRARLDEDEQTAQDATGSEWGDVDPQQPYVIWDVKARQKNRTLMDVGRLASVVSPENRAHIARHDPARVLREVAAKRLMLDEALASRHHVSSDQYETRPSATEAGREPTCWDSCGRDARVHRTLELLAMPYVDHPDYMQALLATQA
ncbi:DUF6221 family protein [Streptomyces sp. OR43]|uniref:DUF6221 family protein n=1 Tax=Streptomyces sp. or43 TaxID=2478957 RepID=UPI0011CE6252|nr:DUF6221 family protein [Streptomyces sp. or43]TXS34750.1 hypothetical protein EAO72_40850 [Streptomyces sp. or43]